MTVQAAKDPGEIWLHQEIIDGCLQVVDQDGRIDFIKLGAGIIIVSVFFIILLVFHLVDMTINRDKYRV